jgi:hypothetical protein
MCYPGDDDTISLLVLLIDAVKQDLASVNVRK